MCTKMKALSVIVVLLLFAVFAQPSHAEPLALVGPVDPVTTFPAFYQDTAGLSLAPCFDNNGFCTVTMLDVPNPLLPVSFPDNIGGEGFYYIATADAGATSYEAAIEFAWANEVVNDGDQVVFARIRFVNRDAPEGVYIITHPYGVDNITVTADDVARGRGIFVTEDIGLIGFDGPLGPTSRVGPFLRCAGGPGCIGGFVTSPEGNVYIGDSVTPVLVTGTAVTSVTVAGAPLDATTNLFALEGKVIGLTAAPSSVVFPPQKPVVTTASAPIIITNIDALNDAVLSAGTITGVNAADFSIATDTCSNQTIPASGTCTVTVNFSEAAPGVSGLKSAAVSIPIATPLNRPPVVINLAGEIDNILPTVVSTIPADSAVNVPSNNAITATFSEVVTGVSDTTFTLSGPSGAVTGTVSFDAASRTATFTPAANLTTEAAYTATITTGVTDLAGNALAQNFVWSFTTTLPDTTPPAVVSNTPTASATGVPTNQVISVVFNEPVSVATVNAATFALSSPSGAIAGAVTYDTQTRTARFTPSQLLAVGQAHTVTITTGVQSLGGVPMAANVTWTFATTAAPTAPQLVAPAAGQTGLGTSVDFQWVKSTDSDNDAITYRLFYCTNGNFVGTEAGCTTPVIVAQSPSLRDTLAGLGGYGVGLLLAGFAIMGGVKSLRKLFFLIAVVLISGMAVTACSNNDDDQPAATSDQPVITDLTQLVTRNVTGLTPARQYFWKVVADDGKGALTESATRTFTTQ